VSLKLSRATEQRHRIKEQMNARRPNSINFTQLKTRFSTTFISRRPKKSETSFQQVADIRLTQDLVSNQTGLMAF